MKKAIGVLLIIVALVLAYMGYQEYSNATVGLEIGDLELSAGDQDSQMAAYVMWGVGIISLLIGGKLVSRG